MDKDAVVVGCSKTRTSIVVAAFQQQQRQQQQPRLRLPRSFRSRLPELQGQKPFPGRFEAPRSVVPAPRSSRVPLFFSGSRCRHRNSCRGEQPKTDFHRNTRHGPLFGGTPNNNNGDGDSSNDKNGPKEETSSSNTNKERMVRMKRVGGRRRNREKPRDDDETNETNLDNNQKPSGLFSWWKNNLSASFVLTALLVLTLLKNLFFGGGGGVNRFELLLLFVLEQQQHRVRNPNQPRWQPNHDGNIPKRQLKHEIEHSRSHQGRQQRHRRFYL